MAHFIGVVSGRAKTEASRLGSKESGISGHIRGWDQGGRVVCEYNKTLDMDLITIYATTGSNGAGSSQVVAKTNTDTGKVEPVIHDEALSIAVEALKEIANEDHGERTDADRAERALRFIFERRLAA